MDNRSPNFETREKITVNDLSDDQWFAFSSRVDEISGDQIEDLLITLSIVRAKHYLMIIQYQENRGNTTSGKNRTFSINLFVPGEDHLLIHFFH